MSSDRYDDLVEHLVRTTSLSAGESARVVDEVLGYFTESVQDFVRRRHTELRARGLVNEAIFASISTELPHRRVTAPDLTRRQLRRIVYG